MSDAPEPGPDIDAVLRLQSELERESPRGIVLVSAAMLEEGLRELLIVALVPNPSSADTLFDGPTAPFSSFSAKIDAAYRLGRVSDRFCRDLHIIRRIRNDVAHKSQGFTFEDVSAKERIGALSKSHGMYARSPKWTKKHGFPTLQDQYLEAASWMIFFLVAERERIEPMKSRDHEFGYVFTLDGPVD